MCEVRWQLGVEAVTGAKVVSGAGVATVVEGETSTNVDAGVEVVDTVEIVHGVTTMEGISAVVAVDNVAGVHAITISMTIGITGTRERDPVVMGDTVRVARVPLIFAGNRIVVPDSSRHGRVRRIV